MVKYLHTMIRVADPEATVAFFKLIGLEEVRRFDSEAGRFTLIFLAAPGQAGLAEVELTYNWPPADGSPPEEYTGGSAAISNMGMMNVKNFAAIVNPPHASILAIGSGERRPVVRGNDIVIEQQMTITLSTDHRCIDGALGAEFIGAIKAYLEEPGLMLV